LFLGDLRRHNLNLHEGKLSVEGADVKPDSKNVLKVAEAKIDSEIPS
jgi:hypothetical protein